VAERLAKKHEGVVDMFGMNSDQNPEVPQKLETRYIPLFVFYREGREVSRMVGPEEAELEQAVATLAGAAAAPAPAAAAPAPAPAAPRKPRKAKKKPKAARRAKKPAKGKVKSRKRRR
jgi:thioredoxin-like negative regulator of GroEL